MQINVPNLNPQLDILIKKLDQQRFLNLDNFNRIPLHQFSTILQFDKELEFNLKEFIAQKFDTQFSWFIQDQCIVTHLDCQNQIDQFLDRLFYTQTNFKQYADYLTTYHQIKVYSTEDVIPLKCYKKQNKYQQEYLLYGFKKQLKQQNAFEKPIVRHEYEVPLHYVFIEHYVPIIKNWIEKHLYTFVEMRRGQQILDLYGPYNLVKKANEILMKEYSSLNIQSGILKFKDLDDEQIQLMQIQEVLNQNQFYDYEMAKQNSYALDELEYQLKSVKSRIFSAILVIDFKNQQLCNNGKYYFNFDLDRKKIEFILESEVYELSKTYIDGKALSYVVIMNGRFQQSLFLKKLNEEFAIIKEFIYNINQINYLRNLREKEITNLINTYQIKLKFNSNCICILGKQKSIDDFLQFLIKQISPQVEIIDYYFFKNKFNFNVVINDYKNKFQEIISKYECQNFIEEKETKIKIICKDSIKILQFKQQLEQLEKDIEKSKKTIQISIEKSLNKNLSQQIQQITQKFPSIEIIFELNENNQFKQVSSFTKKLTQLKIYYGQPNFIYDIKKEVLNLKNCMILIPIEKIHNQPQPIQQQWVNDLIQQYNITLIDQKQNSSFEFFQYQLNLKQRQIDSNSNEKYVSKPVEFYIYQIYYRDILKPQNYIHYFDKQNLNKSFGKIIDEIQILNPKSIIITNLFEQKFKELKGLLEHFKKVDFPQIQVSLMISEKNDLTELKSLLNEYFEEDNPNDNKQTYYISITGCIQETLAQVIQELNEL